MPPALSSLLCFTVSIGSGDLFFDFAQVNDKDEEKRLIDGGRVCDGGGDFCTPKVYRI